MLGFSLLVWPFSRLGMGIEKKKIVLASLSPELSDTVQRQSCRYEHLSHRGRKRVKEKGGFCVQFVSASEYL